MVKMQLRVISKIMDVNWAIHYKQSLIKKWKFGKSHNGNEMKTIGSVSYGILM